MKRKRRAKARRTMRYKIVRSPTDCQKPIALRTVKTVLERREFADRSALMVPLEKAVSARAAERPSGWLSVVYCLRNKVDYSTNPVRHVFNCLPINAKMSPNFGSL